MKKTPYYLIPVLVPAGVHRRQNPVGRHRELVPAARQAGPDTAEHRVPDRMVGHLSVHRHFGRTDPQRRLAPEKTTDRSVLRPTSFQLRMERRLFLFPQPVGRTRRHPDPRCARCGLLRPKPPGEQGGFGPVRPLRSLAAFRHLSERIHSGLQLTGCERPAEPSPAARAAGCDFYRAKTAPGQPYK